MEQRQTTPPELPEAQIVATAAAAVADLGPAVLAVPVLYTLDLRANTMAHFANIEGNKVSQVIVVSNDDIDNLPFPESEPVGQAFIASLGITGEWLQTSYSGSFRGTYAGIGFTYSLEDNLFIPPATIDA